MPAHHGRGRNKERRDRRSDRQRDSKHEKARSRFRSLGLGVERCRAARLLAQRQVFQDEFAAFGPEGQEEAKGREKGRW